MLDNLKKYLKKRFDDELKKQGHHLSGALEESIEFKEQKNERDFMLEMWANYYVKFVDKGVKAKDIEYPFARARIDGLTRFWKLRGLSGKDAKNAAFATAAKHANKGMPTKDSYEFSTTGKRTEFTEAITDEDSLTMINKMIGDEIGTIINAQITNMIQKTNKKLK